MSLELKNKHRRDDNIFLDESEYEELVDEKVVIKKKHIYVICGETDYMSVTTFVHSHFDHFDAEKVAEQISNSKKAIMDEEYEYYSMSKEEILEYWSNNAQKGTDLHYDIECYYNNIPRSNNSIEYKYFMNFVRDHQDFVAFRTEWRIYSSKLKLAGSIDMVFIDPKTGKLKIYDWKRSKEIKKKGYNGKKALTKELKHIDDCNFYHYSLQLNIYKYIIEKNYGYEVDELCLVILHPNYDDYVKIPVKFMKDEIKAIMKKRRNEVLST